MRLTEERQLHVLATNSTIAWMNEIIAAHQSAIKRLEAARDRFADAATDELAGVKTASTPVETLSWFVNETRNLSPNVRIDLAVNHASVMVNAGNGLRKQQVEVSCQIPR